MTTLRDAIDHYIAWQRSHGVKFVSGAYLLNSFCRRFHEDTECDAVIEAQVRAFLAGNGPLTRSRATRYGALAGFYRYAISRRYASCSPLPVNEPPRPRSAPINLTHLSPSFLLLEIWFCPSPAWPEWR